MWIQWANGNGTHGKRNVPGVPGEGSACSGHSSKKLHVNIIVLLLLDAWNPKLEKENMRIWRKTMAGNHTLCLAHTCSNVPASTSFIENMAREGGCTDDQKARSHHGDDPQKHQDCPETTVNWRPPGEKEKRKPHLDCEPHLDCTMQSVFFLLLFWFQSQHS